MFVQPYRNARSNIGIAKKGQHSGSHNSFKRQCFVAILINGYKSMYFYSQFHHSSHLSHTSLLM